MKTNELTHLVVLDFEATCDDADPPDPQEIIEFPSVLLATDGYETIDEFESFVRPVYNPKLTAFCTELTSITQDQVDPARPFPEVLDAHLAWLQSHGLPIEGELPYAIVTCGDWDLKTMLPIQLKASGIDHVPAPYRQWINLKVPFKRWNRKKARAGMARMLQLLDLELEGRHHRGIDDCRNIAKIVRALVARHQKMEVTATLPPSRYPAIDVVLERDGREAEIHLAKRALATLLGAASGAFRHQAKQVFLADTELVEDIDLVDLRSGVRLRVR